MPLPLALTLASYFQLADRIRKHYVSPGVMGYLASGQFVPPIHRKNLYSLQYSMLPAQRVSIGELWRRMTSEQGSKSLEGNGTYVGLNGYSTGSVRKGPNGYPSLLRRTATGR